MAGRTNEQLSNFCVKTDYPEVTDEELNMAQYFEPGEWEKNSPFEKTRLSNIARNFFFMKYMGWITDERKPDFMQTKRQRAAKARARDRADALEKEPDKDWKPRKPAVKKPYDPFLGDKPKPPAVTSRPPPREVRPGSSGDAGNDQLQPVKVMKARIVNDGKPVKRKAPEPSRRSERTKTRLDYSIPDEDRYIWCADCGTEVLDSCSKHPMTSVDDATPEGRRTATYAERTLPTNLQIRESGIPNAGRGVFARSTIRKNTRFGPYGGETRDPDSDASDSGYSWAIYDENDNLLHYCDARDPSKSNWMRFVNCANSESEQNVSAFQYHGQIFYKVCKSIRPGDEMLTYYGDEYALELGLMRSDGTLVHPPKNDNDDTGMDDDDDDDETSEEDEDVSMDDEEESDSSDSDYEEEESGDEDIQELVEAPRQKPVKSRPERVAFVTPSEFEQNQSTISESRRRCVPLAGNTKEMNELPDMTQYYNTETKRFSCPCCIHKLSDYVHVNILIQHVMNEHSSINPAVFRSLMVALYEMDQKGRLAGETKDDIERRVFSGPDDRTCGLCGKQFSSAVTLSLHKFVHTGDKPFTCNQCGKGFTQHCSLNRHQIIHTGLKPHECSYCGKRFNHRSAMRLHVRSIHENQRFKCTICDHTSSHKHSLKRHMLIHTGEKLFVCDICDYACNRKSVLKTHLRYHSGEKPYVCDICDREFTQRGAMNRHKKNVHK